MQSLKELYYTEGRGSIFTYRKTRTTLRWAGFLASLTSYLYFKSFSDRSEWIFLFTLSAIGFVIAVFFFIIQARIYFKWKDGVDEYLKEVGKYDKYTLVLGPQALELINDEGSTIEKWDNFKKASIYPKFISLDNAAGVSFTFPAKSMSPSEYEALKEVIRKKIGTGELPEQ